MKKRGAHRTFNQALKENYERRLGADNVIVVWRTDDDAFGGEIARYYQSARSIPAANMIEIDIPDNSPSNMADIQKLRDKCIERINSANIHAIVLCGDFPKKGAYLGTSVCFEDYLRQMFTSTDPADNGLNYVDMPQFSRIFTLDPRSYRQQVSNDFAGLYDDPKWTSTPHWSASDSIFIGDVRKSSVVDPFAYICDIAGTTGLTEPSIAPSGYDPAPYYTDGTVRWRLANASQLFNSPNKAHSGLCRYPLDFLQQIRSYEDVDGATPVWQVLRTNRLFPPPMGEIELTGELKDVLATFVVTRLTSPAVHSTDAFATRLDLVKNLIDTGIAFESAKHSVVPGTQIISGDVDPVHTFGVSALSDLLYRSDIVDSSRVFWKGMSAEMAAAPDYTVPSDTNYQVGDNAVQPTIGKTFTPVTDLFFHAVGVDSYFNSGRLPFSPSEISYTPGAIALFGRSCGLAGTLGTEIDYDVVYELNTTHNSSIINLAANEEAGIAFENNEMTSTEGYRLKAVLADSTVQVTAIGEITLTDTTNGTTVLTVPPGTLRAQYLWLDASLPAEWTATIRCPGAESRGAYALRNGAVVAIGSLLEPTAPHAPNAHNIFSAFLSGCCLAEALRLNGRHTAIIAHDLIQVRALGIIGDPLYRPFGHFESNRFL